MSTIEELKLVHPWGKPLADIVKAKNPTRERVMLAFSLGKDSIMCWIWLEEHGFDVVPLYRYMVPGLSFVDEAVAYYEKKFGKRIAMVPHPSLYRMINKYVFQPPERLDVIDVCALPDFDYEDQRFEWLDAHGEDERMWLANGVRAADSPMRRRHVKLHGPINYNTSVFLPVWEATNQELEDAFDRRGIALPADYWLFGRSLDGFDYRFTKPIRDNFPDDYRKLLEWFPFIEAEHRRYDFKQRRVARGE